MGVITVKNKGLTLNYANCHKCPQKQKFSGWNLS